VKPREIAKFPAKIGTWHLLTARLERYPNFSLLKDAHHYMFLPHIFVMSFLGAFAKLRKATIIFIMSIRMEQLTPLHRLQEIQFLSIFRKCVEQVQVSLKHDKNNECIA
jgi:hypothetical protein